MYIRLSLLLNRLLVIEFKINVSYKKKMVHYFNIMYIVKAINMKTPHL
jgi:hypothetical protein